MLSFMYYTIGFLLQKLRGTQANLPPTQIPNKFFTSHEKEREKTLLFPKNY